MQFLCEGMKGVNDSVIMIADEWPSVHEKNSLSS